jgi:hypothetical protein
VDEKPEGDLLPRTPHGEWEYRDSEQNRTLDICSVRPAKIVAVAGAEAGVPGAVVRTFSGPGRAFCRVHSDEGTRYSEYLFATLAGEPIPPWRPSIWEILDSLLGPFDVQDLVAAYLQAERGYIALPARYKDSTIALNPDDLMELMQNRPNELPPVTGFWLGLAS